MPIYQLKCPQCYIEVEMIIRHDAQVECSECGETMERVISAPALTPRKWRADKPKHKKKDM